MPHNTAAFQYSSTDQQLYMSRRRVHPVSKVNIRGLNFSNGQPLQAEVLSGASVQLIERITHAARARSPELSVQSLYLLKLRVNRGSLVCKRHESRVLRLECGGDRC